MAELSDDVLAYSFQYPVTTTSGRPLKMTLARPPEKYGKRGRSESTVATGFGWAVCVCVCVCVCHSGINASVGSTGGMQTVAWRVHSLRSPCMYTLLLVHMRVCNCACKCVLVHCVHVYGGWISFNY